MLFTGSKIYSQFYSHSSCNDLLWQKCFLSQCHLINTEVAVPQFGHYVNTYIFPLQYRVKASPNSKVFKQEQELETGSRFYITKNGEERLHIYSYKHKT